MHHTTHKPAKAKATSNRPISILFSISVATTTNVMMPRITMILITISNFIDDVLPKNNGYIILKFTADWCAPCKSIKSLVEEKTKDLPTNVQYYEIDVDENIDLFSYFSHSLGLNFLGSNDPTPPAITIFGVLNSVPLFVFTSQFSLFFFTSSTLSLK